MSFDVGTRVLSGTPKDTQSATTYTYKVEDRNGDETTAEFTIEVEADTSPTLTAPSDQTWVRSTSVNLTLPASSSGNQPLTYTLTGSLPTGVNFNDTTRVLSGKPTGTQSAKTYTYKVEDSNGDDDSETFTIAVEADSTPTLATTADQEWVKDAAVSITLPASSKGNDPLTYTLTGDLPTGVSFDDGTRVLSGTPTATQSAKTYTYKVTDRDGDKATDVFTIEVEANTSPSLTATSDQTWVQGVAVSLTLPESSAGNEPLTYTLANPPTGVSFNSRTRKLSGTPTVTQTATTYTYTVRDKDGEEAGGRVHHYGGD